MNSEIRQKMTARILDIMGDQLRFTTNHAWAFYGNKEGFYYAMDDITLSDSEGAMVSLSELIDELDPNIQSKFLDFCIKKSNSYLTWNGIDDELFEIVAESVFEDQVAGIDSTDEDEYFLDVLGGH